MKACFVASAFFYASSSENIENDKMILTADKFCWLGLVRFKLSLS
jgi:hypothetical protein